MSYTFNEVGLETAKCYGKNQENRVISRSHVQKLKREMLKSFALFPAITVNRKTNNIIDGQHRVAAFISLMEENLLPEGSKLKVMYVDVAPEDEINVICDANQNSKNWGVDDFIARYVKNGNESYVKLENWCLEHSLCFETKNNKSVPKYRYGAAIMKGSSCSGTLKTGEFRITDEDVADANIKHAEMLEIIDKLEMGSQGAWIESLAISWSKYRQLHSFKDWIKKIKANKKKYMKMPKDNQKDWDRIFNEIHSQLDLAVVESIRNAA